MTKKSSKHVGSTRTNPQAKFSKKQIKAIVEQIETGDLSRTEACQQYGMAYGTVLDWMKRYGSSSVPRRVPLTPQQRRQAASAVVEGRMSVKEVQAAHNIASGSTVRRWVREYKQQNSEFTALHQSASQMSASTDSTTNQQDKELQQARLKIAALETMIDVAEQQFNISIRKKPGAKQ